jgi:hypothetical protein
MHLPVLFFWGLSFVSIALVSGCSKTAESAPQPGTIPPPAEKANVTYNVDIKPILEASCVECHGEEKQKGELRLDSKEATIKGGEEGPIFEVGKSGESILITTISRVGDEENWMPPIDKGEPLTLEQIALIRAWIDQGAN